MYDDVIGKEIGRNVLDDLQWENLIRSYRRRYEQRRRSRLAGAVILIIIAISLAIVAMVEVGHADVTRPEPVVSFDWTASREEYGKRVNDFLTSWFDKCSPRKLARALELVPTVIAVAEEERFNPSVIAAIISFESTWQPGAIGKLGEVGLMQINRRGASADPAQNIRTGIGMLREGLARCSTPLGAVSYYATGSSCRWDGARRRLRLAEKIDSGVYARQGATAPTDASGQPAEQVKP